MTGFPEDTTALDVWASAHVEGYAGPARAIKYPTGQSNPTYRIETPGRAYVLRCKPPGKLLKSAHMVEREFRVLRALGGVGYPVPPALALCEDESVAGSVFYVMAHVEGEIYWDPALPEQTNSQRAAIYDSMNAALAALHSVDLARSGLADFGKPGNYFARQTQRWTQQYRDSETATIRDMDRLIDWLAANMPPDDGRVSLVHGDFRIDNMIFAPGSGQLLAVLDWELSTIGHPFADLAYQCMQWRLPNAGEMRGLGGIDRVAMGLPSDEAYVAAYCQRMGLAGVPHWPFLIAFSFFRFAAILQGVYKRALDGNASNPERGVKLGAAVPLMARLAMEEVEGA